jgi:hypothetical protein
MDELREGLEVYRQRDGRYSWHRIGFEDGKLRPTETAAEGWDTAAEAREACAAVNPDEEIRMLVEDTAGPRRALWGAHIYPKVEGWTIDEAPEHVGRAYDAERFFCSVVTPEPAILSAIAKGRRPIVSLFPAKREMVNGRAVETVLPWAETAKGEFDQQILPWADLLGDVQTDFEICYGHEPEDQRRTHGTSEDFKAAFAHVVELLKPRIPRARFGPIFLGFAVGAGTVEEMWPGDDVCEFFGADVYSMESCSGQAGKTSFADKVADPLAFAESKDLELWICETNTCPDKSNPNYKPDWWAAVPDVVRSNERIKAVVAWTGPEKSGGTFKVDDTPAVLEAYTNAGLDPVFAD